MGTQASPLFFLTVFAPHPIENSWIRPWPDFSKWGGSRGGSDFRRGLVRPQFGGFPYRHLSFHLRGLRGVGPLTRWAYKPLLSSGIAGWVSYPLRGQKWGQKWGKFEEMSEKLMENLGKMRKVELLPTRNCEAGYTHAPGDDPGTAYYLLMGTSTESKIHHIYGDFLYYPLCSHGLCIRSRTFRQ